MDVSSGVVKSLNPLPRKNWDTIPIDASDRDGGNGKPGKLRTSRMCVCVCVCVCVCLCVSVSVSVFSSLGLVRFCNMPL